MVGSVGVAHDGRREENKLGRKGWEGGKEEGDARMAGGAGRRQE